MVFIFRWADQGQRRKADVFREGFSSLTSRQDLYTISIAKSAMATGSLTVTWEHHEEKFGMRGLGVICVKLRMRWRKVSFSFRIRRQSYLLVSNTTCIIFALQHASCSLPSLRVWSESFP